MQNFIPNTCIDLLFDYVSMMKQQKIYLPEEAKNKRVAIVGAGIAGLCSAFELLKLGIKPSIFEASDRIGGRACTQHFDIAGKKEKPFAELGAMRIPASSAIFRYYACSLGVTLKELFPDPRIDHTTVYFNNTCYDWTAGTPLPPPLDEIDYHWKKLINPIFDDIYSSWKLNDIDSVRQKWQKYIDTYKNRSLYEVLRSNIPMHNETDLIQYFGAIGFGAGGLSSLYYVNFLEILRVLINAYDSNHYLLKNGISDFLNLFYTTPLQDNLSLSDINSLQLNTVVICIDYNRASGKPVITYRNEVTKETTIKEFDAVIYTGTTSAAHLLNLSLQSPNGEYIFDKNVRTAIRSSHMVAASKTFICTKDKFWKRMNIPRCLITDELPRAMYFLDYPNIEEGIVCLSYSWGMDSQRLQAVSPEHRVIIFRRIIERINSNLARELIPVNDEVINIDWFNVKYQNGAFKLLPPGYEHLQQKLYYQFKSCLSHEDKGIYLAGDCISWSGGWIEGAMYTALNSFYSVCKRFGAEFSHTTPLDQNEDLFYY